MSSNIIIVNDGAYRWGADREELEAAMRSLGWEQSGRYWIEPESDNEDDPGAEYTRLCDIVQAIPGMDSANGDWNEPEEGAWDNLPRLQCDPQRSGRHWKVYE